MTSGTALLINIGLAVSWFLIGVFCGIYWPRRARYGMAVPANDPHQHCDRNPVRCTWQRIGDTARDHLKLLERYEETLRAVADCPKCAGCSLMAKTTLAPGYEED